MNGLKNSAKVAKRKAIKVWIPKPAVYGSLIDFKLIKKRKFDIDTELPYEYLSKRARLLHSPIIIKAVIEKAGRGLTISKTRDLS